MLDAYEPEPRSRKPLDEDCYREGRKDFDVRAIHAANNSMYDNEVRRTTRDIENLVSEYVDAPELTFRRHDFNLATRVRINHFLIALEKTGFVTINDEQTSRRRTSPQGTASNPGSEAPSVKVASKRAEELAQKIRNECIMGSVETHSIAALIAAYGRKERERCADRAVRRIEAALYGKSSAWPCTASELRAAIVSEKE